MRQGLSTSPRFSRALNAWPKLAGRVSLPAVGLAAGLLTLGAGGCSSAQKPDLTVTSLQSGQRYSQQWDAGFVSRDGHGDTDVVLSVDANHPGGQPGVLKQVMHIRVMWHSDRDTQWEGAADTNASIRWYVFTDRSGQPEMLEYAGTGRVAVKSDGEQTSVTVQNASLRPAFSRGDLSDPIGPSRFEGTVVTRADRRRVDQLLSEVRTTLAATSLPPVPVEAKTAEALAPILP